MILALNKLSISCLSPRYAIPLPVETSGGTTVFKFEKFQRLQNVQEYLFSYDELCCCEQKKYKTRAPSVRKCTLKRFDQKRNRKTFTTCSQRTSRYRPALTQLFSPTAKYFIVWKIIILVSNPFQQKNMPKLFEMRIIINSNGTLSAELRKLLLELAWTPFFLDSGFWLQLLKFNCYIGRGRQSFVSNNTQFLKCFWGLASCQKLNYQQAHHSRWN